MASYFASWYEPVAELYSYDITVYAKETMTKDPDFVWQRIDHAVQTVFNRKLQPHTSLHMFTEVLVNTNDQKGAKTGTKMDE
eukprot:15465873-Alexandrium_andersonii.AAC.1